MTVKREVDISALWQQGGGVRDAIRRGGLEAMKMYIRAGESMDFIRVPCNPCSNHSILLDLG